jgi:hypothetical protein
VALYLPPSLGFVLPQTPFSTWVDHIPFGYDVVQALQPAVLVELGTQGGASYFTFCHSVRDHDLSTHCFAVDTWRGDSHTQEYDDGVFAGVRQGNEANFGDFSTLLRMRFEDALERFEDASIGLLHIDGYHTYDAVRGDFERWFPKVEPGGIVLMHDVVARLLDFGAWRYWSELSRDHETFLFRHGFGLGVVRKAGGDRRADPALLRLLFSRNEDERARLRAFYVHACEWHEMQRKKERLERMRRRR